MRKPQLLTLNLATDADDPILGFTTNWIRALARHCEHVDVITMRAGRIDLPGNVRVWSLGKERGFCEPRRVVEFYRALAHILSARRVDLCFAHMAPHFAVMASPVLVPMGIPIVTWYAHPRLPFVLRLAHRVSAAMVTSLESAYPYRRDKLQIVGQGIDTDVFRPESAALATRLIVCAGRLSPVKDHPTLLRAAALLQREAPGCFELAIVGGPARPQDAVYASELEAQVQNSGLADAVKFYGSVVQSDMPQWYRRAAVHVNLTPKGFGDKVALEAMSCGTPCVTANADLRTTLGPHADALLFTPGDAVGLAAQLRDVLAMPEASRREMGRYLREQVIQQHGLDRLARRLLEIGLTSGRRTNDAVVA